MQSFKSTMVCMSKSDNPLLSYLNDDLSVRLILANLIELVILSGCVLHKHYLLTFRCFVPCSNCFFFHFSFVGMHYLMVYILWEISFHMPWMDLGLNII